ncbi:MAG: hypothetical protein ACYC9J_07825 [Sulfuricaulis sp.]
MILKWVFAALVLANLGLWMWASWYRQPPGEEIRLARAPIAPEQMRLLSEPGAKLQPRQAPPPANAELTATAVAPDCLHIGPLPDMDMSTKAEAKLNELHITFTRRVEETKTVSGYQVYLPPLASREAAERKRQELTRLGFKDHALMQDPGWDNAISLGLFAVEANAAARVHDLTAKGIEANVRPLTQNRTSYWLDISEALPVDIVTKLHQTDWGSKDIQLQQSACPPAANLPPVAPRVLANAPTAAVVPAPGMLITPHNPVSPPSSAGRAPNL